MEIWLQFIPGFLLVLCRITCFFVTAPVFSTHNVPVPFRIGLAFFVSLITFLTVGTGTVIEIDALYFLAVIREVLVGLLLGFLAYMFFTAVQVAGSFTDLQIGFGMANMVDPLTGVSSPLIGNFKFMLAILLFLSFNGHHLLLQGIMGSYQWVPLDHEWFAKIYSGEISQFLLKSFGEMFMLAFQLAAPLVVSLFLADVGLGILARTAPQFNIFVVGFPFKILLGFILLLFLVPSFADLFRGLFARMFESMRELLQLLS